MSFIIVETLVIAGAVAVGALAAARLGARARERALGRTLRTASAIVSEGLAAGDPLAALDGMTARLARLFDADVCVIALPTGDGRLGCNGSYGYPNPEELFIGEDEGMTGYTYSTGRPLVAPDVRREPRFIAQVEGIRSAVTVPLRYEGRVLGAFNLEARKRRFSQRDLAVLEPLADQIAAVIDNLRLRADLEQAAASERKARQELQAISSVVMAGVASGTVLDEALASMIEQIATHMGWESMAVILFADDGLLYTRAAYGYPEFSTRIPFAPGRGIVGAVAKSGVGRAVGDVSADPDYLDIVSETRSEMCVPLRHGHEVLGVLNAESPRPDAFSEDDLRVLTALAEQMSIVIERARLIDLEHAALQSLREADRLKDDFVATLSHELRTPLTSIKGSARTMLVRGDDIDPNDREAFLRVIVRQCDRLAGIIDGLLLVSQVESGVLGGERVRARLEGLLREAAEASGVAERVLTVIPPRAQIVTDSFRLHHIVRNLLENAAKYSPAGSSILVRAAAAGGELTIEVCDQGPGIPRGDEERIFERFLRLAAPGTSKVSGTGLGLYIARRFARDLGGDITVGRSTQEPWLGARFTVRLPDVLPGEPLEAPAPEPRALDAR